MYYTQGCSVMAAPPSNGTAPMPLDGGGGGGSMSNWLPLLILAIVLLSLFGLDLTE